MITLHFRVEFKIIPHHIKLKEKIRQCFVLCINTSARQSTLRNEVIDMYEDPILDNMDEANIVS